MPTPMVEGFTSARWRYRFAVLLTLGAFNLITFNRYFPLTEGWWETYGYLYNSGLKPYRDFDLAFTPLFTIVNAGLLHVFGDSFFSLRLFGVAVFLSAVLVLELLLERFYSPKTAAVAVTVATFFVIQEPQFIAKDYHFHQLGLVVLSLLIHVWLAGDNRLTAARRVAATILLGVVASLVFFLKQNLGALLLVAIAASLPLVERERPIARLAAFAFGAALLVLAMLPIVSPWDWRQLLLANDAKGDLGTVLGRFAREPGNWLVIRSALKICAAYAVVRFAFAPPARWNGIWTYSFQSWRQKPLFRNALFVAAIMLAAASGRPIRSFLREWIIPTTLALLGIALYRVARKALDHARDVDPRIVAIALPVLALAYANTTTAVFDFISMHIPVALAIGWLIGGVEAWAPPRTWAVAAVGFLAVVPKIAVERLSFPYTWWGHVQASVFAAKHECEYPQLRRMYVDAAQRETLDAVKHAVDAYSRSQSDVLFFDMPVFYWLHGKLPPFRAVVQWFDVVTSKQMDAELRAIRERPPRLIVALEPPPAAYAAHRRLKKQGRLSQEDFRALMDEWVVQRKYRLVRSIALPSWIHVVGEEITQEIVVQSERSVGLPLGAVAGRSAAGVTILQRLHGSAPSRPAAASTLEAGDVVAVRGEYERIRALSEVLGVARGEPRDWNTVNVYVREDAVAEADAPL